MKAYISQVTPINQTHVAAVVHVIHGHQEDIRDNVAAAISESTNREFMSVSGSITLLESTNTETFLRCIMAQTKDIKPASEATTMTALSANMYMDASEQLWSLKANAGNDILVRSSDLNNSEELLEMIASCSSVRGFQDGLRSKYPAIYKKHEAHMAELATASGGDMVSFVSESATHVGFIAAQVQDVDKFSYLVVDNAGEQHSISCDQIVALMDGSNLTEFPDVGVSMSSSIDVNKLVDYYKRVFSYNPEYYDRIENIIRQHAFH